MQYSVQYIIAPFISDGTKKTEGLASLSMKKGQSRIYIKFSLWLLIGPLFSSGDGALVSMQLSSSPDATLRSDMDAQHATPELCMPSLCFLHLEFNPITSLSSSEMSRTVASVPRGVWFGFPPFEKNRHY